MIISQQNETPIIDLHEHTLVIAINASSLKAAAESSPETPCKILDENKFLAAFADEMLNYQHSNASETGVSFFQYVLGELIEQTIINADEDTVEIE